MTFSMNRRQAATVLLLSAGAAACGPPAGKPLYTLRYGSRVIKVFVEGQVANSSIETTVAEGGTWTGEVNGLTLSLRQGRLLIGGEPYNGPEFEELHVTIKPGGRFETQVAK